MLVGWGSLGSGGALRIHKDTAYILKAQLSTRVEKSKSGFSLWAEG